MTEQAFEWSLTPTERRIAEIAFAAYKKSDYKIHAATHAVLSLRGKWSEAPTHGELEEMADAMLAELRREPAHPCDEHDTRITRLVEGATAHREQAERYRALLERIAAEADSATIDDAPATTSRWQPLLEAIYDARKEIAK